MKKIMIMSVLMVTAFFSRGQFNLAGSAVLSGSTYILTPTALSGCVYTAGAIWNDNSTLLNVDFDHCFKITYDAMFDAATMGHGADGICAVFGSNILPTSVNNTNAYLGYYDLVNWACVQGPINSQFQHSLAVEFDIFHNSNPCFTDPAFDHIQFSMNANLTPLAGPPVQLLSTAANAKDGIFHPYELDWDCTTNTMSVYVDGVFRTSYSFIPSTIFSTTSSVPWGFTSGTGTYCSNNKITNVALTLPVCVCCVPPVVDPISGSHVVCVGDNITLTDPTLGGTWGILGGGTTIATISAIGVVTGVAPGTVTVTYTVPGSPCSTTVTFLVNVVAPPVVAPIMGAIPLCIGDMVTLTDATPGGSWSGSGAGSINSSGVVTGLSAGTFIASYTISTPPCSTTVTVAISVTAPPVVAPITGPTVACVGVLPLVTLANATPGGFFGALPSTLATITPGGTIMPSGSTAGGIFPVYYTVISGPCTTTVYYNVYIQPQPTACVSSVWMSGGGAALSGYYFNFTCSSPTATVYYRIVDCYFNPLPCPLQSTVPGTLGSSVPLSLLSALCTGACGVCIVGYCDGGCCWGITASTPTGPAIVSCCALVNHLKSGNGNSGIVGEIVNSVLSVYPNPNVGTFNVVGLLPNVKALKAVNLQVTDLLGKLIFADAATIENGGINKEMKLNSDVPNGVYMIRIKNDEVNEVIKFTLDR